MFVGHFGVGFGAKPFAPKVSLGILFLACQLADLVWPNLVLLGVETVRVDPGNTAMTPLDFVHYPYSHSLLGMLLWATTFAVLYAALTRAGTKAAIVVGLVACSHWVLDVLTHRPDMPVAFGESARLGLGLWNMPALGVAVEVALFAAGVWLYARCTRAANRQGSIGLWVLVGFLLVVYAMNLLGPPPPSANAVAWAAQSMWLIVAWGFWVDRNRVGRDART